MTLTIDGNTVTLPTALEAQFSEVAAARGEDQTRFAVAALRAGVAALAADVGAEDYDPATVSALQEGLNQVDSGQGRPFTEFVAEVRIMRQNTCVPMN